MIQTIIVGVILALMVFFAVRWLIRTLKGKGGGCGCGCQNCPMRGTVTTINYLISVLTTNETNDAIF